jgi:hypothetical protein
MVRDYLEQRKNELRRELQDEFLYDAITARKVMSDILQSDSAADKEKITVARDFLDRAGFGAAEKVEARVSSALSGGIVVAKDPYEELTTEELRKLARLADEDNQKT